MKIYIVTSGEYSDYAINEVFIDERKAKKYCEVKNKSDKWYKYIVEEHDTHDENIKI